MDVFPGKAKVGGGDSVSFGNTGKLLAARSTFFCYLAPILRVVIFLRQPHLAACVDGQPSKPSAPKGALAFQPVGCSLVRGRQNPDRDSRITFGEVPFLWRGMGGEL